ncbi:MAG: ATP-binding protein [Pseudonocardiaceae bacterium]
MTTTTRRASHLGQFRLTRLQVVNWGTFCGYKDFPIDERGVLLTGPSGCGKSSLMDAHSLALLPTNDHRFNASADLTARGSKQSTRGVADYVRGAWSETNDEAERSQTQYLRGGVPTWSAVGATYSNGLGFTTTAVVVKWFTGVEIDGGSLSTMYQLHDDDFDLVELNSWAERKFDTRWFKQTAHPEAHYPGGQEQYLRELSKRIGVGGSRTALSLLGKAKAMKNVGDLNLFIRDHMLDEPGTWAAAERALATFTPLNKAYETAKRAADQERVLHHLPAAWAAYKNAGRAGERAAALRGAALDCYMRGLLLKAIERELDQLDTHTQELDDQLAVAQTTRNQTKEHYQALDRELSQKTASLREHEQRVKALETAAELARTLYDQYSRHVAQLDERCPRNEIEFAALRRRVPALVAAADMEVEQLRPAAHEAIAAEVTARNRSRDKREELVRLESARTLIPAKALSARDRISAATNVPTDELPYAAELIDVADGQERWRPAAEKVLRSYGMRLLVPEQHKDAVRGFIDRNDMRGLVEYSVVTAVSAHQPRPPPSTLAGKLVVDPDHPHGRWLAAQLAQKFQHACVESAREMDDHRLAVTVHGTVKMPGNYYRKDDRPELASPASYILGADTARKRSALAAELGQLDTEAHTTAATAEDLNTQLGRARARTDAARKVGEFTTWTALDYWSPQRDASELAHHIKRLRVGDTDLRRLEANHQAAEKRWETAVGACQLLKKKLADAGARQQYLADRQLAEQRQPHTLDDEDDHAYLDELRTSLDVVLKTDAPEDTRRQLDRGLAGRADAARNQRATAHEKVRNAIDRFLEYWRDAAPDDSGDVDRSGQDFADLHADIVNRRLPDAMTKFQQMISEDMVPSIALLLNSIDTAVREIRDRIEMVNAGLRRVEFDSGTHLQISYTPELSADVRDFRDRVDELMSNAPQTATSHEASLAQFRRVRELMRKFTENDPGSRRWKSNVLDVRLSYIFYGREVNQAGETSHTYRNTGTNSGGEQEKLVAFCLAAALSYNLADHDSHGRPRFAVLMLDEAFSKSDETYAAQALAAFDEFGFQLIMAAPIRMSGIVEPFIGEAILIEKRKHGTAVRSSGTVATFGELSERRYAEHDGEVRASA